MKSSPEETPTAEAPIPLYSPPGVNAVQLVDVSPRDGLQNEDVLLSAEDKAKLVIDLAAAGVTEVEVASFVSPRAVPALADAEEVCELTTGVGYRVGLALNLRGVERAIAAGVNEIRYVVIVTDEFSKRNSGVTTQEALDAWPLVAARAREGALLPSLTLSAAFGCAYEGAVPERVVIDALEAALAGATPHSVILADTIGVAVPGDVARLVRSVQRVATDIPICGHFHDSRGTAVANVLAAIDCGVTRFDSSVAGVGGCPFSPNASGNVATEDLVYVLDREEITTGIDLSKLVDIGRWLERLLGRSLSPRVLQAGPFPVSERTLVG